MLWVGAMMVESENWGLQSYSLLCYREQGPINGTFRRPKLPHCSLKAWGRRYFPWHRKQRNILISCVYWQKCLADLGNPGDVLPTPLSLIHSISHHFSPHDLTEKVLTKQFESFSKHKLDGVGLVDNRPSTN